MNDLLIKAKGNKTPTIDLKVSGELLIEGRSICENPIDFYNPVVNWLEELKVNVPKFITLKVKLEFFNTGSGKIFVSIFKKLGSIRRDGAEVKIIWYYSSGDEEILQAGIDYESIIDVPFSLVEIPADDKT